MNAYKTDLIQHDHLHCMMPGLFRSLGLNERKDGLELSHTFNGGVIMTVDGPECLGTDDLRILQSLVALTSADCGMTQALPDGEEHFELREAMRLERCPSDRDILSFRTSFTEIASEAGYISSKNTDQVKASLERMQKTAISVQKGEVGYSFRMISFLRKDKGRTMLIGLNPLLARAIKASSGYVGLSMAEARALNSDPARILYQRLCSWVALGSSRKVSISVLASYVWPSEGSSEALKKRLQTIKKSVADLVGIGWSVRFINSQMLEVSRPRKRRKRKEFEPTI